MPFPAKAFPWSKPGEYLVFSAYKNARLKIPDEHFIKKFRRVKTPFRHWRSALTEDDHKRPHPDASPVRSRAVSVRRSVRSFEYHASAFPQIPHDILWFWRHLFFANSAKPSAQIAVNQIKSLYSLVPFEFFCKKASCVAWAACHASCS